MNICLMAKWFITHVLGTILGPVSNNACQLLHGNFEIPSFLISLSLGLRQKIHTTSTSCLMMQRWGLVNLYSIPASVISLFLTFRIAAQFFNSDLKVHKADAYAISTPWFYRVNVVM